MSDVVRFKEDFKIFNLVQGAIVFLGITMSSSSGRENTEDFLEFFF